MEGFEATVITFRKGGECGISVKDGISKRYSGLEGRDSRPFEGVNVSNLPALRINVSSRISVGTPPTGLLTIQYSGQATLLGSET